VGMIMSRMVMCLWLVSSFIVAKTNELMRAGLFEGGIFIGWS